jgi:hypothetical protein
MSTCVRVEITEGGYHADSLEAGFRREMAGLRSRMIHASFAEEVPLAAANVREVRISDAGTSHVGGMRGGEAPTASVLPHTAVGAFGGDFR